MGCYQSRTARYTRASSSGGTLQCKPLVGVAVYLRYKTADSDKTSILLGRRKGGRGDGTWAPPGGHLELGESFEGCAQRELLEETGITLSQKTFVVSHIINDIDENLEESNAGHYVCVVVKAEVDYKPMAVLIEPDKCHGWAWYDTGMLPTPLFSSTKKLFTTNTYSSIEYLHLRPRNGRE